MLGLEPGRNVGGALGAVRAGNDGGALGAVRGGNVGLSCDGSAARPGSACGFGTRGRSGGAVVCDRTTAASAGSPTPGGSGMRTT